MAIENDVLESFEHDNSMLWVNCLSDRDMNRTLMLVRELWSDG